MAEYLLIVESPAKANTIKKFLGTKYKVVASMGHVRDLPKSQLGVDLENNFEPKYINMRDKGKVIKQLKTEAKGMKQIILATDPDREGEAIAWHLAYILGVDQESKCRVTFNEITKEAVQSSIKAPRKLNLNTIDAQQARRILDRIVGYKISPLLWKKVQKGLSAGRVQSVATRLVVEREQEIENFEPEEYWSLAVELMESKSKKIFEAKLMQFNNKKIEITNKDQMDSVTNDLKDAKYIVESVKIGTKKRNPVPPYTTSTLQQDASRRLGFTLKKTMMVAQQLYEGVKVGSKGTIGLITYMRTDSVRISEEARSAAKEQIINRFGEQYYAGTVYKSKASSQDGHEAIRPTYLDLLPMDVKEYLSNEQFKLYNLIYNKLLASQMSSAIYDTINADISANKYLFRATGSKIKFDGFLILNNDKDDDSEDEKMLPMMETGDELKYKGIKPEQHFTEPPSRYTEATLVKELEDKGIGRPSTYAPTITTIMERRYVEKSEKKLYATELGKIVTNLLVNNFGDIVNVKFTAEMEDKLDGIEEGHGKWKNLLQEFYTPFAEKLKVVEKELEHVQIKAEESDVICEHCGKNMVYKYGRFGKFLACPGFPDCRNIKSIVETTDTPCPNCGGSVLIKKSKKNKKYYICENNNDNAEKRCEYISFQKPKKEKVVKEEQVEKAEKKSKSK